MYKGQVKLWVWRQSYQRWGQRERAGKEPSGIRVLHGGSREAEREPDQETRKVGAKPRGFPKIPKTRKTSFVLPIHLHVLGY